MLDFLYPASYITSLLALILWFYAKDNHSTSALLRTLFFGGLIVYLGTVIFSPGLFGVKLFALSRDLLIMGLISQFFSFLKNRKTLFFVMLATLVASFFFIGRPYMQTTFSETATAFSKTDIAENGELLVE
ncbi:MAG: hypothetical protein ACI8P3_002548, partial [Saprospiraceae bacterium]